MGIAVILVATLFGSAGASAQVVSDVGWAHGATLSGVIADETQAAIPGVLVTALNTGTGTLREARSGGDGWFLMPLLPPGDYLVTAERDGFAPLEIRGVQLGSSDHLALRIRLRVRGITESVTVTGTFLALDLDARILPPAVGQWVQGVRVGGELQRRLPLSPDRGFADVVALAPGVVFDSSTHFVHGVSGDAAVVLVDGADVSSMLAGNPERLRLGLEAIEAVEVRTAGLDASIPLSQGAVISVVTKSGTNQARGGIGGLAGTRGMMADSAPDRPRSGRAESDVAVGGPVLRDRWWFFGADRATAIRSDAVVPQGQADALRALVPGWQPEIGSDGWNVFFVKQTARIARRHDLTAFYQRDALESTALYSNAAGPLPRTLAGGNAYSARWASVWSDAVMTRASISYNDKSAGSQVRTDTSGPSITVYQGVSKSADLLQGTIPLGQINPAAYCCRSQPARKLTVTGELTWYKRGWGSHEIQAGLFSQPYLRYRTIEDFRGLVAEDAVLREPLDLTAGFIPFRREYFEGPPAVMEDFRGQDEAVYLQDTWRPASWLTLGAGLRADWLQDRERTTDRTSRRTWAIGPRVSTVLEPTPRDTFRAGWGRIHESPAGSRIPGGLTGGRNPRVEYDLNLDGLFETILLPGPSGVVYNNLDLRRGQPYVNELTLGYRRRLPNQFAIDLGFVARGYHDIPVRWSGTTYIDGNSPVSILGGVPLITANTWNHPVVADLTAQVSRQTARLQFAASYNRNWRHLEGTWLPDDPAAILQPSAFPNNRGIGNVRFADSNSLSGYADTATAGWVDHSLVIAGSYIAASGVTVAAMYRLQSGLWSGPVTTMIAEPDPRFPAYQAIFPDVKIPNPLGTTVRFAYPTRGDGQLRLPTVHTLALRFGFRRSMGWGRIEPAIDLFNPMNWDTRVSWMWGANEQYSPGYGRAQSRQQPRSVVASLRLVF